MAENPAAPVSATPSAPSAAPVSPPAAPMSPPSTPVSAPPGAQQTPSSPSGAAPGTPGAPTPVQSYVRDQLRSQGYDPSQFQSDEAALQHLMVAYRQAQQGQQLSQYGQRYLQHAPQFEGWLQQQEAQQRAAQQQKEGWFKAPDFDPSWRNQVVRDPQTGKLVPAEGASPDVVNKLNAWYQHQLGFMDKFAQDPIAAIRPGLEQVVQQMAQQVVQQHLGGYQDQQFTNSYLSQNPWLFQHDGQGQQVSDQQGRPVLSPEGRVFREYLRQADSMGIRDIRHQQSYALGMLQRDIAFSRMQQQQAPASAASASEAAKAQFLQQAAGTPPANPPGNNAIPASPPGMALQDRMRRMFGANGYQAHTPIPVGSGA